MHTHPAGYAALEVKRNITQPSIPRRIPPKLGATAARARVAFRCAAPVRLRPGCRAASLIAGGARGGGLPYARWAAARALRSAGVLPARCSVAGLGPPVRRRGRRPRSRFTGMDGLSRFAVRALPGVPGACIQVAAGVFGISLMCSSRWLCT